MTAAFAAIPSGSLPKLNSAWTVRKASWACSGHECRDLDLARGDHLDVDALLGQRAEHPLSHAGLRGHAKTDNRDLRHLVVAIVAFGPQRPDGLLHGAYGLRQFVARDGERDVR